LLKTIYRYNVIPITISIQFFTEIGKKTLTFYCTEYSSYPNAIQNKRKIAGATAIPDLKLYYRSIITKNSTILA
jgi:phage terminase small subunit